MHLSHFLLGCLSNIFTSQFSKKNMVHLIQPSKLYFESLQIARSMVVKQLKLFHSLSKPNFLEAYIKFRQFVRNILDQHCSNELLLQPIGDEIDPSFYYVLFVHDNTKVFRFISSSNQRNQFKLGDIAYFDNVLPTMKNLTVLQFPQFLVTDEVLKITSQNCIHLKCLSLNGNLESEQFLSANCVTPAGLSELSSCTKIQRLSLPEYDEENCSNSCSCFQCHSDEAQLSVLTLLLNLQCLEYINYKGIHHVISSLGTNEKLVLAELELHNKTFLDFKEITVRCPRVTKLKLNLENGDLSSLTLLNLNTNNFQNLTDLHVRELPNTYGIVHYYLHNHGSDLVSLSLTLLTHSATVYLIHSIGHACPILRNLTICDYMPTGDSFTEPTFNEELNYKMFECLETLVLHGITWTSSNVLEIGLSYASRIRSIQLENFTGGQQGLQIVNTLRNVNKYNEFQHLEELCCYSGLHLSCKYLKDLVESCPRLLKICVCLNEELNVDNVIALKEHVEGNNLMLDINYM